MYSLEIKDDCLDKCYDIHKEEMEVSKEEFLEEADAEEALAITYNGETVGGVWFQEGIFMHLAVEEKHRGKWAYNLWPDILMYITEVYGQIIAPVGADNKETIALMPRAGFTHIKDDEQFSWWKI